MWFKKAPMVKKINNLMKQMVLKSNMPNPSKKFTNHSARKSSIKKMKQAHVPRSEIIGITGHSTESGLDPYDSGDEVEQRAISLAIDGDKLLNPDTGTTNKKLQQQFDHPCFSFFPDEVWKQLGVIKNREINHLNPPANFKSPVPSYPQQTPFQFNNCTVTINQNTISSSQSSSSTVNSTTHQSRKLKRRYIIDDSSSDEE